MLNYSYNHNNGYLSELEITRFISRDNLIFADILIITDPYEQYSFIEQELLDKILVSVRKLAPDLVFKLLQIDIDDDKFFDLTNYSFKKIIVFNKLYFNNQLDSKNVLLASSISELSDQVELKKQLWQQLQVFCRM
ncbi:MAG: hypothetical protein KBD64_00895 [Gammaproteobacteria bacterium]|nr:hypothetical protein [Gammaproteobacteria bacterium]